jgi:hypothetical protein
VPDAGAAVLVGDPLERDQVPVDAPDRHLAGQLVAEPLGVRGRAGWCGGEDHRAGDDEREHGGRARAGGW